MLHEITPKLVHALSVIICISHGLNLYFSGVVCLNFWSLIKILKFSRNSMSDCVIKMKPYQFALNETLNVVVISGNSRIYLYFDEKFTNLTHNVNCAFPTV